MKVELTYVEAMRICSCLVDKALIYRELADKYKKEGYSGISDSQYRDGLVLMELKTKISKAIKDSTKPKDEVKGE